MKKLYPVLVLLAITANISAQTTWSQHIAPILYANCTNCHHTSGIAPFSLMTYADAYANASSIKNDVTNRIMPPWPADPNYKHYVHERVLSAADITAIQDWVNNGAAQGNPTLSPPQPTYILGSQLGTVDLSITIPTYTVSGSGDVYRDFVIPSGLGISKYITAIEVIPGNPSIVHHVLLFQDSTNVPAQLDAADPGPGYNNAGGTGSNASKFIAGWAPGGQPYYTPVGLGFKLAANTNFVVQLHYPDGSQGQVDSTRINLKLSTAALRDISVYPLLNHFTSMTNGPLSIPANQVKTFHEQYVNNITNYSVLNVFPHMHLIGRSFKSWANAPVTNDTVRFVDIPSWDFHWQGNYVFPNVVKVLNGSTLHAVATYDNTANNPYNPNSPPQNVVAGEQTTDEMMLAFFAFLPYQTGDENIIVDRRVIPMGATTFCTSQSLRLNTIEGTGYHYQWYRGTTLLSGDTTANYYASQSGNYYVKITLGTNNAWSDTIPVTVSSPPNASITPVGSTTICPGQTATLNANSGTGYQYQWFLNNTPINNATSATYGATAGGNYTVQVYNGCYAVSNAQTVTSTGGATAGISASGATTFCQGGTLSLTASGGTAFHWSNGSTSAVINPTTSNTYTVTVTDANGCTASKSQTVTVNSNPNANISANGPTTICQGTNLTLTATGGTSFQWSNGSSAAAISPMVSNTYTVTVTDPNGCSATKAQAVTINTNPTAGISANGATTICQGGTLALTASGGTSFHWSNGSNTATINPTASNNYTVTVTDANGCTASAAQSVTVNPNPAAGITPSGATTFCQGNSVTITATGNGNYHWSNSVNAAANTVTTSGTYAVTVTDANNCSASSSISVTVNPLPSATLTTNGATTFCDGGSVTLSVPSGNNYHWSNNATTNSINITTAGNYVVTVTSGAGCSATSSTTTVTVNPMPTASASFSINNNTVTFTNSSQNGTSYSWDFGDGSSVSTDVNPVHTYGTTGQYQVVLTTTNGCGDKTDTINVNLNCAPFNFTIAHTGNAAVCAGQSVVMNTTASATSYQWLLNGQPIANANANNYTASQTGIYSLQAVDGSGCPGISDTISVHVLPLPDTTITITGATAFCPGDSVFIQATVSRAGYQWYADGNPITNATMSNLNIKTSGVYHVQMIQDGCQSTTSDVTVTVYTVTTPTVTKTNHVLSSTTATAYEWYNNAGMITGANSATYTATENNCYYVKTYDGNNCAAKSDTACITDIATGIGIIPIGYNVVSIYPNPGTDELNVSVTDYQGTILEITDMTGRVVYTTTFEQPLIKVNVAALSPAMYLVHVKGQFVSATKHWVKAGK